MGNEARGMLAYDGEAGPIQTYLARPRGEDPRPAVIVIHEIVGLTDHIKRVADRFAEEGYVAFAPHLFSRPGLAEVLTPSNVGAAMQFASTLGWARMSDRASVQQAMSQLPQEQRETVQRVLPVMFGGIPKDRLTQDLVKAVDYLNAQRFPMYNEAAAKDAWERVLRFYTRALAE